jgi:hypothetical protein
VTYAERRKREARRKAFVLLVGIEAMQTVCDGRFSDSGLSTVFERLAGLDACIAGRGHPFLSEAERDALRSFQGAVTAFRARNDGEPKTRYPFDIPRLPGWHDFAVAARDSLAVLTPRRIALAVELGRPQSAELV